MPALAQLANRVTNSPGLFGTVPVFKPQEWLIHPRWGRQNTRMTPQIPGLCCTHSFTQLFNPTFNVGVAVKALSRGK